MEPLMSYKRGKTRVTFETNPFLKAVGPIRSIQKYAVIALTTKGSDSLLPWFGTQLSQLPLMNMYNKTELTLFIKDEVASATKQFFTLQQNDADTLAQADVIDSIELISINISDAGNVSIEIMFYPLVGESIKYSLEV